MREAVGLLAIRAEVAIEKKNITARGVASIWEQEFIEEVD
jgi:hypothetical protein